MAHNVRLPGRNRRTRTARACRTLAVALPAAERVSGRRGAAGARAMSAMTRITRLNVVSYSLGSFGTGVFSTVPAVLLLYYCTNIVHLPALWAAAIVFVPKVWAILWDPLVGAWSDRASGPFGRRRPFLAVGAAGVAAAFFALFSPP